MSMKVITWARWTLPDFADSRYCTVFTASILKPSWEYPVACAAMVIHRGNDKVFIRLSYEALKALFVIPSQYRERLDVGYQEAWREVQRIQEQQRALHKLSSLPPGSQLVNTGTGEVIAEAERILSDGDKAS